MGNTAVCVYMCLCMMCVCVYAHLNISNCWQSLSYGLLSFLGFWHYLDLNDLKKRGSIVGGSMFSSVFYSNYFFSMNYEGAVCCDTCAVMHS